MITRSNTTVASAMATPPVPRAASIAAANASAARTTGQFPPRSVNASPAPRGIRSSKPAASLNFEEKKTCVGT